MPDEAGDECMDWFSFYERLYTINISTGRSTEPIGLEKYLDAVVTELREQLPEEPDESEQDECQLSHQSQVGVPPA